MNYNFDLDSSGACVRWTLDSGDAGLCARGWTSRFGRQGFLQAQCKPWLVDVTHSMKLLWTLSKFTLNNLHTPHHPQDMCGSQSRFLGNFPFLYLWELVSNHWSWDPSWYRWSLIHLRELYLKSWAEASHQSPRHRELKLRIWLLDRFYTICMMFSCVITEGGMKRAPELFSKAPTINYFPLFYISPSDYMIGNTCHEFTCHQFPSFS